MPDEDAQPQHQQPRQRILDAEEPEVDEPVGPAWPGDADRVAAEPRRSGRHGPWKVRDHLVGHDHGDGDRDQRLPQILTLVPPQQQLLHAQSEERDAADGDEQRQHPFPRRRLERLRREALRLRVHLLLDLVGDVAAQEVEGAVGHVDDPHEPEDEREAAGDDEQQAGERQGIEQDLEERLRVMDRRAEVRRPPVAVAELVDLRREEEDVDDRERSRGGREQQREAAKERLGADAAHQPRAAVYSVASRASPS